MSWNRRHLALLVPVLICLIAPIAAARAVLNRPHPVPPVKVVSITEDIGSNFVLLNLQRGQKLPVPIIRYLPGPDGTAIMAADFPSTILTVPALMWRTPGCPIKRVTVGQLTSSPPVVRATFTASGSAPFKAISFRSTAGSLTVRLTAPRVLTERHEQPRAVPIPHPAAARKLAEAQQLPPTAPDRTSTEASRDSHLASRQPGSTRFQRAPLSPETEAGRMPALPVASPMPALPVASQTSSVTDKPAVSAADNAAEMPVLRGPILLNSASDAQYIVGSRETQPPSKPDAAARTDQGDANAPPAAAHGLKHLFKKFFGPPAPTPSPAPEAAKPSATAAVVSLSGRDNLTLTVETGGKTQFKTFRLHNPERYVIDMEGITGSEITVPAVPEQNRYIKGLRVGSPEGNPDIGRLVIDLTSEKVGAVETPGAQDNSVVIAFGDQSAPDVDRPRPSRIPPGCVVILDAGHGGSDPGAQRGDIQEKAITLEIVEKLKRVLSERGVQVRLTRNDDTFVSLEDRVRITNETHPSVFVSIHINSLETNQTTTGIETYFETEASKDLAELIHTQLVKELGAPDRSVRKARFYVINHTPVPAVLAEVGFISNKEERDKLTTSDYQAHIAQAVADGVLSYLSARPVEASQPPTAPPRARNL